VDLSRWKVVVGGSALPKGLAKAALERGIDVFAGYGLSESGPVLTLAQPAGLRTGMSASDRNRPGGMSGAEYFDPLVCG